MGKGGVLHKNFSVFQAGQVVVGLVTQKGDHVWVNLEALIRKCRMCTKQTCVTTCNSPGGPQTPLFNSPVAARRNDGKGRTGGTCGVTALKRAVSKMPIQEVGDLDESRVGVDRGVGNSYDNLVQISSVQKGSEDSLHHRKSRKKKPSKKGSGKPLSIVKKPERIRSFAEFQRRFS
ncbi:MAG TPA: hypothetical protein PLV72_02465 [Candidatus Magasanikbacteria bacterium]|nr:hypothetical protein [Candidatus Magasanikbacteria bacterium]